MDKVTIFRHSNSGENIGALDYVSATHDEDLDGTDRLTVETPAMLSKRDRLVWKDNAGTWHEHMCDNPIRPHAGGRAVTRCDCSNSISELYGVLAEGTVIKGTVQSIMSALLSGTRWNSGTCSDFGVVEIEVWHRNVRECIAELCELVSGELETVITVGDFHVASRTARIVSERGGGTVSRQFSYARNVGSVTREVGADEVYTAIKGFGAKMDKSSQDAYAQRVEVTVESGADLSLWGIRNPGGTMSHNWTTYTDNACTSKTFLTKQCAAIIASQSKPLIRYEFDITEVDDDIWTDVQLGSRVHCVDDSFGYRLELIERVSHITRRLSGRISCKVAIGKRANPLVERFKAVEKTSKKTTGNGTRISGYSPILTGGEYSGGSFEAVSESMPFKIHIEQPPTKLNYIVGDDIDYSGISVILKELGDETYTDEWYPDGHVPFDELIFPIQRAMMDTPGTVGEYTGPDVTLHGVYGGGIGSREDVTLASPVRYAEYPIRRLENKQSNNYWGGQGIVIGRTARGGIIEVSCSEDVEGATARLLQYEGFFASSRTTQIVVSSQHALGTVYIYGYLPDGEKNQYGSTVDFISNLAGHQVTTTDSESRCTVWQDINTPTGVVFSLPECADEPDRRDYYGDAIGWFTQFGEFETYQVGLGKIPVYWTRSDGERLSDTFEITVESDRSGGSDDEPTGNGGGGAR